MKLCILGERSQDKNTVVGWIRAGDLAAQFDKSWFPPYQRDRVNSRKKINEIKAIVTRNGSLPAVVINLLGDVRSVTDGYNFTGDMHVIDGQQRILAMIDANNPEYLLFVQAHINLAYEEEVKEFQNLNTKGTKVPFSYLVRSMIGPAADTIRKFARKGALEVPITVNDKSTGITMGQFAPIMHCLYKKLVEKRLLLRMGSPKQVTKFLENNEVEKLSVVEFASKNLMAEYAKVFGKFDNRSLAYTRSVFFSVNLVIIHNFMTREGKIDWRSFDNKISSARIGEFINNSYLRELAGSAGSGAELVYDEFIKHLNNKVHEKNRLLTIRELKEMAESNRRSTDSENETFAVDPHEDHIDEYSLQ